jgi:hypothetical protein
MLQKVGTIFHLSKNIYEEVDVIYSYVLLTFQKTLQGQESEVSNLPSQSLTTATTKKAF